MNFQNRLRDINWMNLLLELVVVFMGITLAFALDRWNETEKTQQLEEKYLQSFRDDLAQDYENLEARIAHADTTRMKIRRAVELLESEPAKLDSIAMLLIPMMHVVKLDTKRSTYESITGSGNLSILSNYELKQALADYDQYAELSGMAFDVYNTYVHDFVIPLFMDNLDFSKGVFIDSTVVRHYKTLNITLGYQTLIDQNARFYAELLKRCQSAQNILNRIQTK